MRAVSPVRPAHAARRWTVLALTLAGMAATIVRPGAAAHADPSANTWYRLRMCESGNNYAINTGNGHYGAYQFDLATWRSVGGSGYPYQASPAEQDARALILYRERGWQPWQCATILGLRADSDAGSGRISDITVPSGGTALSTAPSTTAPSTVPTTASAFPAFPGGSHWYVPGESGPAITTYQNQLVRRGLLPSVTGTYDAATLVVIEQLQRLNGLIPNGYLGPNTWALAWTGRYTAQVATPRAATGAAAVPAFPGGSHWYVYGQTSRNIKTFQDQMHRRGYFPVGTGQFGPNTLRMVEQLQRLNGLVPNGLLGPNTWRLAWTGVYHP